MSVALLGKLLRSSRDCSWNEEKCKKQLLFVRMMPLSRAVRRAAAEDAVIVLRNFGDPLTEMATNCAADDRAMLWGTVDVRPAHSF